MNLFPQHRETLCEHQLYFQSTWNSRLNTYIPRPDQSLTYSLINFKLPKLTLNIYYWNNPPSLQHFSLAHFALNIHYHVINCYRFTLLLSPGVKWRDEKVKDAPRDDGSRLIKAGNFFFFRDVPVQKWQERESRVYLTTSSAGKFLTLKRHLVMTSLENNTV